MPKINSSGIKYVPKDEPHVRWNWEQSPDDPMQVRYHFFVVGYKNNNQVLNSLEGELNKTGSTVDEKRKTKILDGILAVIDTYSAPFVINWTKISGRQYQDKRLRERVRKGTSVEKFVEDLYS